MPLHQALFCLCRIVSYFKVQRIVCQLLLLFNVQYNGQKHCLQFGHQLLIYTSYVYNVICCLVVLIFGQEWYIDSYLFIIYALPCLNYIIRGQYLLLLFNDILHLHRYMQQCMGALLCIAVRRPAAWACLITVQLGQLIYWQLSYYDFVQFLVLISALLLCYLQLLLHINCYIWLTCIYVAMSRVFTTPLGYRRRLRMLRCLLRAQPALRQIHRKMASYFSVYLIVLLAALLYKCFAAINYWPDYDEQMLLRIETVQLAYAAQLLLLLSTLLLVVSDYCRQRQRFERELWQMMQQPLVFYVQLLAYKQRPFKTRRLKQQLDVVDLMLLTGNRPDQFRPTIICLCQLEYKNIELLVPAQGLATLLSWLLLSIAMGLLAALEHGLQLSLQQETRQIMSEIESAVLNFTIYNYVLAMPLPTV